MTTIVKRSAMSVTGLIFGMNRRWYQSFPRARIRVKRVSMPARNGRPR